MTGRPSGGAGTSVGATVREEAVREGGLALYRNPSWEERWSGLRAGITRGGPDGPDFGLSTTPSAWALAERVEGLGRELGFAHVALARQVHGARVVDVGAPGAEGLLVAGEADGLASDRSGVLLVVTAADCVPVYLADDPGRVLGLLHAGWRGVAAGILEAGIAALKERFGSDAASLHVHLGPAICGSCYRVGPEVAEALGCPARAARVDLRSLLAERAAGEGVDSARITASPWCTGCDGDQFHSHRGRGTQAGRMAAYLGRARSG